MRLKRAEIIKIFYCYAQEDRKLLEKLEEHLSPLKRLHQITSWSDREIKAGVEFEKEIEWYLTFSDIILLLVSPSFISSDICYSTQMQLALARQQKEKATVIPILLRPVLWEPTPIGKLQSLPKNNKPITKWRDRDSAFLDVVTGIFVVIEEMKAKKQKSSKVFTKPLAITASSLAIVVLFPAYYLVTDLDIKTIIAIRPLFDAFLVLIVLYFAFFSLYLFMYKIHRNFFSDIESQLQCVKRILRKKSEEVFLNDIIVAKKEGNIDEIIELIDSFDKSRQLLAENSDQKAYTDDQQPH